MRGYADVEVDEFLDEVADEYERLFKENIDLNERVESLQEKIAQYKRIEETLQKTLISAQASAEELKQNATKEAQLILRDAELKARQMVNETYTEKQAIEQTMAKLRAAEQDFRFKFRQTARGLPQAARRGEPERGHARQRGGQRVRPAGAGHQGRHRPRGRGAAGRARRRRRPTEAPRASRRERRGGSPSPATQTAARAACSAPVRRRSRRCGWIARPGRGRRPARRARSASRSATTTTCSPTSTAG